MCATKMRNPNIIFILIDALRVKNLGCYGYLRPTSPNIDKLAEEGIIFKNAFSCINTTEPSLTTIFTGLYPISHGITGHGERVNQKDIENFMMSGIKLLPEILKSKGYTTLAIDWLGRWHKKGYDYYSGILRPQKLRPHIFLLYSIIRLLPLKQQLILYSLTKKLYSISERKNIDNAKIITDTAINLIEKNSDKPFFLFIHYWDVHTPYSSPSYYVDKFNCYDYGMNQSIEEILNKFDFEHRKFISSHIQVGLDTINQVLVRYDAAIAFIDDQIGRIVETLNKLKKFEDTLIIITADHGESLTEHGIYFDHHGLYDVNIRVPLIISYSKLSKNKVISGFVQQVDILPTILDVTKVNFINSYDYDGESLASLINGKKDELRSEIFVEEYWLQRKIAIRTKKYKYISASSDDDAICRGCGFIHGGVKELYDLEKDINETNNILYLNPEKENKFQSKINNWINKLHLKNELLLKGIKRNNGKPIKYTSDKEDKELINRLKKLGYI
jgi:arylsulfatase A-like enzyme